MAPFRYIVNDDVRRGTVIEIGSLIAMGAYLVAAFLVVKLVRILTAPSARPGTYERSTDFRN